MNKKPHMGFVDSFEASIEHIIKVVDMLVDGDETERAIKVLDNVPAFYRDNPHPRLIEKRNQILQSICTAHAYMSSGLDAEVKLDDEYCRAHLHNILRGELLYKEVGDTPTFIVDVGPGEYWAPLGLKAEKKCFKYWDVAMDSNTQRVAHESLKDYREEFHKSYWGWKKIFVALEIIEHLPDPMDLAVECNRHFKGFRPEYIHLSTPMYTYDGSPKEAGKLCGLPHLRAYTPNEFFTEARRVFPGYEFQFYAGTVMSLRGVRQDIKDKTPLLKVG